MRATPAHDTASGENEVTVDVGRALYVSVDDVDGIDMRDGNGDNIVSYRDSDGDPLADARLVATGSRYFIKQGSGAARRYFAADVTTTAPDQITATARAGAGLEPPGFKPVEHVDRRSTITLDPRNVTVNYTDHDGNRFEDALRRDDDGNCFLRASPGGGARPDIVPRRLSKPSTPAPC